MVIISKENIKKIRLQQFNKYLRFKQFQKNNNNYNPDKNGSKYLLIMACHCDTQIKLNTIINNIKYLNYSNIHKIIVNTKNLPFNNELSDLSSKQNNTEYYEVENSGYYDFGKWLHILKETNYSRYDFIVLTNDSFIIHNSINHFFNLTEKHNVQLYGYNDSTQTRYHYQSYLFSLRKDAVPIFIAKISNPSISIETQADVINNFEILMTDWFNTKKSFLKIGNFILERGHNIFFTNDELYIPLKKSGLLPFTKLKRIL